MVPVTFSIGCFWHNVMIIVFLCQCTENLIIQGKKGRKKEHKKERDHTVDGTPLQIPSVLVLLFHTFITWGSHVASLIKFHAVV